MELVAYEPILKLFIAAGLGGLVGLERQINHKAAGLRTHMLVCLSSTLLMMVSLDSFPSEGARIIAGIVTGIGFLGAGNIIAQGKKGVHGLTTAANVWAVAVVGMVIGMGYYVISAISVVLIVLILFLGRLEHKWF